MAILQIIGKELKHTYRSKISFIIMIIFPIVTIGLIGTVFKGSFDKSLKIADTEILYMNNGSKSLAPAVDTLIKEIPQTELHFKSVASERAAMEKIQGKSEVAAFVKVSGERINIYKNRDYPIEASIVQGIFSTFLENLKTIKTLQQVSPEALEEAQVQKVDLVRIKSLAKSKEPGAMDFFGVAFFVSGFLTSNVGAAFSFLSEIFNKTGSRILLGPAQNYQLLLGKVIGIAITMVLQGIVVFLFTKYVYKVYWGDNILSIALIVLTVILMSISMGILIAVLVRNETAQNHLHVPNHLLILLGGGYIPLDRLGSTMNSLSNYSPIKYNLDAVFQIIYNHDFSVMPKAMGINLAITLVFFLLALSSLRREALR